MRVCCSGIFSAVVEKKCDHHGGGDGGWWGAVARVRAGDTVWVWATRDTDNTFFSWWSGVRFCGGGGEGAQSDWQCRPILVYCLLGCLTDG